METKSNINTKRNLKRYDKEVNYSSISMCNTYRVFLSYHKNMFNPNFLVIDNIKHSQKLLLELLKQSL